MKAEKTIKICGKEVRMRYCLASETGYEQLAGKGMEIFQPVPTGKKDKDGKKIYDAPLATTDDYVKLSFGCIIAAYERTDEEPPVKVGDIIYDATPDEIANMIAATTELRLQWYKVPEVVKPETEKKEEDNGKNS